MLESNYSKTLYYSKGCEMQAIQTTFLGPTDHRGPRVKARCNAGSITIAWDSRADVFANHAAAARQLCIKLGWSKKYYGALYGGSLPGDSGYCFVMVRDSGGNEGTFGGYAPDIRCPHYEGPITNDPPTTNDCAQCHNERKGAA